MTAREVLDGIKDRLTKATPGPWAVGKDRYDRAILAGPYSAFLIAKVGDIRNPLLAKEAEFIAAAPVDVARLTRAIENVLALHFMEYIEDGDDSRNRCMECLYEQEADEHCPTVAAIEDALNPKEGQ